MSAKITKKRHYLTLDEKVEVIKYVQNNPGVSSRALGEIFCCGKTQVGTILKNKESLLAMYESNVSGSRVHTSMTQRHSEYEEINKALYQWYTLACSKNIYPGGTHLTEKAKEIAERMGKADFKGSRGWLDKWKKRYNVKPFKTSDSADVLGDEHVLGEEDTVDSWKERFREIVKEYKVEDIWNVDETGFFWQSLPDVGFGEKARECCGGKQSSERVTVAFFVSAAGTKEKPVLVWKSETPTCLHKFDKSALPVEYYGQKNSWMTGEIMNAVLTKLNRRLSCDSRSILLLMDNASCHPEDLVGRFSNIKVCILPVNAKSPLEHGIIRDFKVHYRHLFLQYVLSKTDQLGSASDVVKSLNILTGLRWVAKAWSLVRPKTITKCFWNAGILNDDLQVISTVLQDSAGPSLEADKQMEVKNLMEKTLLADTRCSIDEYLDGDNDLPVCIELDQENWEADFLEQLGRNKGDEEIEMDVERPPPKLQTFDEAIQALEDVQHFLESRDCVEALEIGSFLDTVAALKMKSSLHEP